MDVRWQGEKRRYNSEHRLCSKAHLQKGEASRRGTQAGGHCEQEGSASRQTRATKREPRLPQPHARAREGERGAMGNCTRERGESWESRVGDDMGTRTRASNFPLGFLPELVRIKKRGKLARFSSIFLSFQTNPTMKNSGFLSFPPFFPPRKHYVKVGRASN